MDVWSYDAQLWDKTRISMGEKINELTKKQNASLKTIYPEESTETLINPGRGFATTGRTYNTTIDTKAHPKSGVIQQRWNWDVLEPVEGQINFRLVDSVIALAKKNGQQLNFRIMCWDIDMHIPEWAIKQGIKPPLL